MDSKPLNKTYGEVEVEDNINLPKMRKMDEGPIVIFSDDSSSNSEPEEGHLVVSQHFLAENQRDIHSEHLCCCDISSLGFNIKRIGSHNFWMHGSFIQIYIAGDTEMLGKLNSSAGFGIYFGENHVFNTSEPCTGKITSNVSLIQGAYRAIYMSYKFGLKFLTIHSECDLLNNGFLQSIKKWKENNWLEENGEKVPNSLHLKKLEKLLWKPGFVVKFADLSKEATPICILESVEELAIRGREIYIEMRPKRFSNKIENTPTPLII